MNSLNWAFLKFVTLSESLRRDERGVTAIEYGLIAALIAVVIIASVTLVGNYLAQVFGTIGNTLAGVVGT